MNRYSDTYCVRNTICKDIFKQCIVKRIYFEERKISKRVKNIHIIAHVQPPIKDNYDARYVSVRAKMQTETVL